MSDNKPTTLYEVTLPSGVVHRLQGDNKLRSTSLTNYGDTSSTFFGEEYRYAAISHSAAKETGQIRKHEVTVTLPNSDVLAKALIASPFGDAPTVRIRQAFPAESFDPSNPQVEGVWMGVVGGVRIKGELVEISVESIFTSLQRSGNRVRYTRQCRHALYGRGCELNVNLFKKPVTVVTTSGLTVTTTPPAGVSVAGTVGGLFFHGTQTFYILSATALSGGNIRMTLDRQPGALFGAANIARGCNRTQEQCSAIFNNLANFGGFPYIPDKNPFQTLSSLV